MNANEIFNLLNAPPFLGGGPHIPYKLHNSQSRAMM